ncbi:MAG: dihydrofolate reductase family protein [Armatimonadota bacterium]
MIRLIDRTGWTGDPEQLYEEVQFPEPPPDRPYIYTNTVTTLDGKLILGELGSSAKGLGSPVDQRLMHRLEQHADAVMIGGGTLRADPHLNYPPHLYRVVVTTSGDLPLEHSFFADPRRALVFAPTHLPPDRQLALERVATLHLVGETLVDIREVVRILHTAYEVRYLLVEGGGNLNFYFFDAGMVDELFLTLAPKVKGGAHLPTMVDGAGLPRERIAEFELLSAYLEGSELFLRYRRRLE